MEGVDSEKPLSEGADGGVVMRSCLFSRAESKDERSYTAEEQKEIEKFLKFLTDNSAAYSLTYARPVSQIRALERKIAVINKKNAAINRKKKAAPKVKKRELSPWLKMYKLFDACNFNESNQSTGWRIRAGAQVPSTSKEVDEMLQFARDHHAKLALEHYNAKNMGTKFELVKGLKLFPFPGPRIEHIKYPNITHLTFVTMWCHINFMARPVNADSSDPSVAKLFFAEMYDIYALGSAPEPGVTRCCIVLDNSDEAACEYCKGILHPAGVEFIAAPHVTGFLKSGRTL